MPEHEQGFRPSGFRSWQGARGDRSRALNPQPGTWSTPAPEPVIDAARSSATRQLGGPQPAHPDVLGGRRGSSRICATRVPPIVGIEDGLRERLHALLVNTEGPGAERELLAAMRGGRPTASSWPQPPRRQLRPGGVARRRRCLVNRVRRRHIPRSPPTARGIYAVIGCSRVATAGSAPRRPWSVHGWERHGLPGRDGRTSCRRAGGPACERSPRGRVPRGVRLLAEHPDVTRSSPHD